MERSPTELTQPGQWSPSELDSAWTNLRQSLTKEKNLRVLPIIGHSTGSSLFGKSKPTTAMHGQRLAWRGSFRTGLSHQQDGPKARPLSCTDTRSSLPSVNNLICDWSPSQSMLAPPSPLPGLYIRSSISNESCLDLIFLFLENGRQKDLCRIWRD